MTKCDLNATHDRAAIVARSWRIAVAQSARAPPLHGGERESSSRRRKSEQPASPTPWVLARAANIYQRHLQLRCAGSQLARRSLHNHGSQVRSILTAPTPPARPRDRKPRGRRSHAMRRRARAADAELHRQLLVGPLDWLSSSWTRSAARSSQPRGTRGRPGSFACLSARERTCESSMCGGERTGGSSVGTKRDRHG